MVWGICGEIALENTEAKGGVDRDLEKESGI